MCPIAAYNWSNGASAGVWALNLNNVRGNTNNNVGFRSDSESPQRLQLGQSGTKGDAFRRVAFATAKSDGFRLSGRAINRLESQAI
jgi:hypothetical protein